MKLRELIKKLKQYPQDYDVVIGVYETDREGYDVFENRDAVELSKDDSDEEVYIVGIWGFEEDDGEDA